MLFFESYAKRKDPLPCTINFRSTKHTKTKLVKVNTPTNRPGLSSRLFTESILQYPNPAILSRTTSKDPKQNGNGKCNSEVLVKRLIFGKKVKQLQSLLLGGSSQKSKYSNNPVSAIIPNSKDCLSRPLTTEEHNLAVPFTDPFFCLFLFLCLSSCLCIPSKT